MGKVILSKLSFKPVEKKKVTIKHDSSRLTKKIYCTCIQDAVGEFSAHVNMKNDPTFPDTLVIPFTKQSYDLKGKTKVFSLLPDNRGKYTCFIRLEEDAKSFPGLPSQFTPFRHRHVYGGYIVKIDGKHYFDVTEVCEKVDLCSYLVDNT